MKGYLKAHKDYLVYFVKHKYWVYRIGRKMGLSRWRLIKHDLSKLLPSEWFGYVSWKYEQMTQRDGGGMKNDREFGMPWFLHTHKRNAHHWQYWFYLDDSGETYPVEIPEPYLTELLVDWCSAGVVRFGEPGLVEYYKTNKDKMYFYDKTRAQIEFSLEQMENAYEQCLIDDVWR
jgi:hypothetical protein